MKKEIKGIIKRHPDGYGFFIANCEHPDIFIPRRGMFGVMTNDSVLVQVAGRKDDNRLYGKITQITERSETIVVGKFLKLLSGGLIEDSSNRWGSDIYISKDDTLGSDDGDLVEAEIIKYPSVNNKKIVAKVAKIIGRAGNPLFDEKRVIVENKIPNTFNKKVEKEVSGLTVEITNGERKRRKTLELPFVTIDGLDAKDFDDAIYVKRKSYGFNVVVAIADVSHYVKADTAIDDEAYRRGFSSYFPNSVIPMLPEKLSNNICSLKPDVERLALVADIQMDFKGDVKSSNFYEAIIVNSKRLTYAEAQDIIDNNKESYDQIEELLQTAKDVANILVKKRMNAGSLDLDLEETKLIIDKAGNPIDCQKSKRLFAHRIIEELMLLTNQTAARFLRVNEIQTLNRVHEAPDKEDLEKISKFMFNLGHQPLIKTSSLQQQINKLLKKVKNTQFDQIFNIIILRSLKQACYLSEGIGHFGLNFKDYLHFTSPIRRYPDLVVHRQLKSVLFKTTQDKYDYKGMAEYLSSCERRAVQAERQLMSIKKARLMKEKISQEFDGMISGLTKFGMFVLLKIFDVDGLVRLETLDGYFNYDEDTMCLRSKNKIYKIGDKVKIIVVQADTDSGKIDFVLAGSKNGNYKNIKTGSKKHKKRKTSKTNSGRIRKARISRRNKKGQSKTIT